jgi:glycosyltransferase involved in cell wall biosynthesis
MINHFVITINFNNKDGLRKPNESIVNQTDENLEYIIFYRGSTDGSLDVLNEYFEKIS